MSIFIEGLSGLSWADARAKVRGDLWRPGNSLPDDVVNRALHASVLDLEAECKWLWLENVSAIFSVPAASDAIDLPAPVGRVQSLSIKRGGSRDGLVARPLETVRQRAEGSVGEPSSYAVGDKRLWFDSTVAPETEFEIVFSVQTPDNLDDAISAECLALGLQQQAVIANACSHVALTFMKNEAEAARQRAVYDRIVDRLLNIEAEKRGGMVQPDSWGSHYYA